MRKLILLSVMFIGLMNFTKAQTMVFDPFVMSTLIVNHGEAKNQLEGIQDKEGVIMTFQRQIAVQTERLRQLEAKWQNSLTTVNGIITQATGVVRAQRTARDIGRYQAQAWQVADGDYHLLLLAAESEANLIRHTADLLQDIYTQAFVGGDLNMMSNSDRLTLIRDVNERLSHLRGQAIGVLIDIKRAKRLGFLRALGFQYFRPTLDTYRNTQRAMNTARAILRN